MMWSKNKDIYAICHGSHMTVWEIALGKTLLDVNMPIQFNQVELTEGQRGCMLLLPVMTVRCPCLLWRVPTRRAKE